MSGKFHRLLRPGQTSTPEQLRVVVRFQLTEQLLNSGATSLRDAATLIAAEPKIQPPGHAPGKSRVPGLVLGDAFHCSTNTRVTGGMGLPRPQQRPVGFSYAAFDCIFDSNCLQPSTSPL